MNIGIIAEGNKKALIEDFCVAYRGILIKHDLYATDTTGRKIEEAAKLKVHRFNAGNIGGDKQLMDMVRSNVLDMAIYFYNPSLLDSRDPFVFRLLNCCIMANIPVATNIATAESLILGLDQGDLDWRLGSSR